MSLNPIIAEGILTRDEKGRLKVNGVDIGNFKEIEIYFFNEETQQGNWEICSINDQYEDESTERIPYIVHPFWSASELTLTEDDQGNFRGYRARLRK